MLADIWIVLIPVYILAGLVLLLLVLNLLARVQGGRYVRPLARGLMKLPFIGKQLQKASRASLERQNPELASAMRKLEPHAKQLHDPQQAQKAMSRLTREERAALLEMQEQQGGPELAAMNRQMRRRLEKQQKRR